MDNEWKGSKAQREALRQMFDGRCAYCGEVMDRMQADHVEPVTRLTTDPWGKLLPSAERRLMNPERNVVSNMMPACAPCNNSKGGYRLEEWRAMIQRAHEIVAREKPIFRAAVRLGTIKVESDPIVFHFEKMFP
jgi:hypothetical protein